MTDDRPRDNWREFPNLQKTVESMFNGSKKN